MENHAALTHGNVKKILIRMTIPMIFGMVSMIAFNLIDTFFVGQLGTLELAAISFTFPVIFVITSLAVGIGIGSSALVSKAIGRGNDYKVKRLTTDSLILSLIIVAFFVVIGLLTIKPLFTLLGATPKILELINQYMFPWYLGVIFVIVPMVGNNSIRATGDTKTPAIIMICAVVVNLILDPLLIFGLGPFPALGLKGAAIATVFARATTFILSSWYLIYKYDMITFKIPPLKEIWVCWKSILRIGLPAGLSRVLIPIAVGVITRILASYGPEAVAAFGVGSRLDFFAMAVLWSVASVLAPFIGQNWGAGKKERARLGARYSTRFSLLYGAVMFILFALLSRPVASLFNSNPLVIQYTSLYMMIIPISFGLQGVFLMTTSALNVLNRPLNAALLTFITMFVLYIPLAYIGSRFFGILGIFCAISISYIISGMLSSIVLERRMAG